MSDYKVRKVGREELISANFEQYSENHLHMLIHAIQFRIKIPSLKSMERTEKRNKAKFDGKLSGKDKIVPVKVRVRAARKRHLNTRKRRPNYVNHFPSHVPVTTPKFRSKKTFRVRSAE